MTMNVFPAPRELTETGGSAPASEAPIAVVHDPGLPAQGYRLEYGPGQIRLSYADAAGLRYAQHTLDQLRAQPADCQRAVVVEDWPDFARRGFMLDVSRDRVPTRGALARLVEILALARYNQLELYTEHTFAYSGHEEVWRDASPITAADLRWLESLCLTRGIELVANQNTFGHWERWLAHETYLPRAENSEPQSFAGLIRPPSTLAPTQENADFVTELLTELTGTLRSRRLNIGADETWELGTGVSRARAEAEGLGPVFLDYVEQVARPWTEAGYTVEFWADILTSNPEVIDRIPAGTVPIVWQYDSPEHMRAVAELMSESERAALKAHGTDPAEIMGFAPRAQALVDAGQPFWVAPGTGTWLSLIGRLDNAVGNILDAAEVGTAHSSEGFLLTCWGDRGHYDPPPVSYGPILFAGAVSWSLQANRDLDIATVLTERVFADGSGELGQVLVDLGRVASTLPPVRNASPLFEVLRHAGRLEPHQYPDDEQLVAARSVLTGAVDALDRARPASADGPQAVAEIRQALRWAVFAVDLLASRVLEANEAGEYVGAGDPAVAEELSARLDVLLAQQHQAWLISARPGGLRDSLAWLDPLRHALLAHVRGA